MNKTLKRLACALLTGAVFVSMTTVFADFPDMPDDNTRPALENAVKNGLLTGYDDGTIRPSNYITRAEMGAILARTFNARNESDISAFRDVPSSEWYYNDMRKAVAMGAFQGDGENLNPEQNITFQEAFIVLSRIFDLQEQNDAVLNGFSDKDQIADWARDDVAKIVTGGYWDAQGALRPTEYINRAEFAVLMDNLVKLYIDEPGTYPDLEVDGSIVVRADQAELVNAKSTGDIIFANAIDTGSLTGAQSDRVIIHSGKIQVDGTFNHIRLLSDFETQNTIALLESLDIYDALKAAINYTDASQLKMLLKEKNNTEAAKLIQDGFVAYLKANLISSNTVVLEKYIPSDQIEALSKLTSETDTSKLEEALAGVYNEKVGKYFTDETTYGYILQLLELPYVSISSASQIREKIYGPKGTTIDLGIITM